MGCASLLKIIRAYQAHRRQKTEDSRGESDVGRDSTGRVCESHAVPCGTCHFGQACVRLTVVWRVRMTLKGSHGGFVVLFGFIAAALQVSTSLCTKSLHTRSSPPDTGIIYGLALGYLSISSSSRVLFTILVAHSLRGM